MSISRFFRTQIGHQMIKESHSREKGSINQWQKPGLLYELETLILQATHPPYNVKIPREL